MKEFKVGDRVRLVRKTHSMPAGTRGVVKSFFEGRDPEVTFEGEDVCTSTAGLCIPGNDNLELVTKTLADLEVGDEVEDKYGEIKTVAAVNGRVIELEDSNGHWDDTLTIKEMEDKGWTVNQPTPVPEITEVTLEEVANLKGIPVEQLRIKEGK